MGDSEQSVGGIVVICSILKQQITNDTSLASIGAVLITFVWLLMAHFVYWNLNRMIEFM